MGYIGQAPTKIPLTSADILDGSIALADIANNAIDETKLKDALVGDFSDVTVTAADAFLYGDTTDSGNTKKDTVQGILDLVSSGGWIAVAPVATTSGTSVPVGSSLPAGIKHLKIVFNEVSFDDDASNLLIRFGDSSGIEATGYESTSMRVTHGDTTIGNYATNGFVVLASTGSEGLSGIYHFCQTNDSNFDWAGSFSSVQATTRGGSGGGTKSISHELTQIVIVPTGGSDFDAGVVRLFYQ